MRFLPQIVLVLLPWPPRLASLFVSLILGYYIYLVKSILVPCQVVPYLGSLVDSCKQAFLLLEEKQQKFCLLVQSILASDITDIKTLQHLSGKCKYNHINDSLRSVCCKCAQRTRISVTSSQSFVPKGASKVIA